MRLVIYILWLVLGFNILFSTKPTVSLTDQNRAQNADSEDDDEYLDSNSGSDIQKALP